IEGAAHAVGGIAVARRVVELDERPRLAWRLRERLPRDPMPRPGADVVGRDRSGLRGHLDPVVEVSGKPAGDAGADGRLMNVAEATCLEREAVGPAIEDI